MNQELDNGKRIHRCTVACRNSSGEPDLFFVRVASTPEQYEDGLHYRKAEQIAESHGYEGPFISYDEVDSAGNALTQLAQWESIPLVEVEEHPAEEDSFGPGM